jgi:uncharacterized SAM-binding protein YcdF (DUF218 family)
MVPATFHVKHLRRELVFGAVPPEPADAIALLGCVLGPGGQPPRALSERLDAGLALYRRGLAPLVLVTGGRTWQGLVEADVMAERLIRAGVPADRVLIERESQSTRGNARLGSALLLERGVRSVLVVTQPLHVRRAVRAFAATGLVARGVLLESSYQLRGQDLRATARDLAREIVSSALDLATLATGRPFP